MLQLSRESEDELVRLNRRLIEFYFENNWRMLSKTRADFLSLLDYFGPIMQYKAILPSLYYLLIYADGKVNEREVLLGKKMFAAEGLDANKYESILESYKSKDKTVLLNQCIEGLKKLDVKFQIRCISWLCVIANSDGFMDKEEWVLIYKIYNTELKLSLDEILKTQKELNMILHGRSFLSMGVKME